MVVQVHRLLMIICFLNWIVIVIVGRISADITAEQSAGQDKFTMNIVLRR
jgi:hypothetical protein